MPTPEQDHSDADRQNTREYMANLERMEMLNHAECPCCTIEVHKDDLRTCEQRSVNGLRISLPTPLLMPPSSANTAGGRRYD